MRHGEHGESYPAHRGGSGKYQLYSCTQPEEGVVSTNCTAVLSQRREWEVSPVHLYSARGGSGKYQLYSCTQLEEGVVSTNCTAVLS